MFYIAASYISTSAYLGLHYVSEQLPKQWVVLKTAFLCMHFLAIEENQTGISFQYTVLQTPESKTQPKRLISKTKM